VLPVTDNDTFDGLHIHKLVICLFTKSFYSTFFTFLSFFSLFSLFFSLLYLYLSMFSTPKTPVRQHRQLLASVSAPSPPLVLDKLHQTHQTQPIDRDLVSAIERFLFSNSLFTFPEIDKTNISTALETVASNILTSTPANCPLPLNTQISLTKRFAAFDRLASTLQELNTTERTRFFLLNIGEQLAITRKLWYHHSSLTDRKSSTFHRILQTMHNGNLDVSLFFKSPDIVAFIEAISQSFHNLPSADNLDSDGIKFAMECSNILIECLGTYFHNQSYWLAI
jgi:hypothetical protein